MHGLGTRAEIIIALDRGDTPTEVSNTLNLTRRTVYKWKERYLNEGIEGLEDLSRSGRPTRIEDNTVKKVLSLSEGYIPEESTHWSIRLMAKHAGISNWQARKAWKAFDIKPHLTKIFKISNDPNFADKVVDIVGLYMNPPANAVELSIDEKTQIQALDRTLPRLPLSTGHLGAIPTTTSTTVRQHSMRHSTLRLERSLAR